MLTFFKTDNAIAITLALVKALHAKITITTLKEKLENHPDYPSMLAISDVLKFSNIDNFVVNLTPSELHEVPMPCIAPLYIEGGIFALVNSVKDNVVEWWHYEDGKQEEDMASFMEKWQGMALLVQASEATEDKNYEENRRKEWFRLIGKISLILGCMGTITLGIQLSLFEKFASSFVLFLLVTKLIGIGISVLLLWYLLDKNNPFLKSICQVNKKANCNSILNSKAASIGNIVSWSEIGFFYFAGSFLALLANASNLKLLSFLAIINILTLPYTAYSIYYQAFIAKKWCVLCLSVQVLLWVEFALFYFGNMHSLPLAIGVNEGLKLLFCFAFPVIAWYVLKPILTLALQTDVLTKTLKTFQNNLTIFKQLLSEGRQINLPSEHLSVIEFGNPNALNVITVATNPYCEACSKKHFVLKKLIEDNSSDVKCQIIFLATNDPKDIRGEIIRHIFSLNENIRHEAIDTWFAQEDRKFDIWKLVYPVTIDENASKIVKSHFHWCRKSNIRHTPSIFINGHLLPDVYKIEDFSRIAPYYFSENKKESIFQLNN
jgi:uncharacterized membrane protein